MFVLGMCPKVDVRSRQLSQFDEHASSLEDTCEASMVPISALDSMPDSLESGAATAGLSAFVIARATSRASWLPIPRAGPSADWSVTIASRALPRVGSPRIFDSPALSPQEVYMRLVGHRCIDADMQVVVVAAELTVGDRKRMRSSRQLRENTNKGIAPDLRMVSASMWCSSGSMGSKGRTRTVAVC